MLVTLTLMLATLGAAVATATPRVRWWFSEWAHILGLGGTSTPQPTTIGYGVRLGAGQLPYPTQRTEPATYDDVPAFTLSVAEIDRLAMLRHKGDVIVSWGSLEPVLTIPVDDEPRGQVDGDDHGEA